MAKSDLIRDAKARGLDLTGAETVDDLKAMLDKAGESKAEVDEEAEAEEAAVAESAAEVAEKAQAVADAEAALAEAREDHEAAKVAHKTLTVGPDPVLGKDILLEVEGGATHDSVPMPAEWGGAHERRFNRNGVNYEHVSEGINGVWVYRRM